MGVESGLTADQRAVDVELVSVVGGDEDGGGFGEIGKVERAGYSLVPLNMHYSKGRVKLEVGLAKGKRQFEKRADEADKDWKREQSRLLKQRSR